MSPVTCEQCGKRFGSEHGLKIHVGRRHSDKAKAKAGPKNRSARRLRGRGQTRLVAGLDIAGLTIDQLLSLKSAVGGRLAEIVAMLRKAKVGT